MRNNMKPLYDIFHDNRSMLTDNKSFFVNTYNTYNTSRLENNFKKKARKAYSREGANKSLI